MGRLIDCNDVYNAIQITTDNFGVAKKVVEDNMLTMLSKIETAEAIPKAEYEARLKADMVAMLTDIQLEIEEKKFLESNCTFMDKTEEKNYAVYTDDISKVIQQKIDSLKAESEE